MKNILIITDDVFTYSGREKVCSFMVKVFHEIGDVDVFSCKNGTKTFHDFTLAKRIITPVENRGIIKQLTELIIKNKYDCVFVASMGKLSIRLSLLVIRLRLKNIKFYACEHVSFESLNVIVKFLKILMLRFYTKIIVLTQNDRLIYTNWGISSEVIENNIDYKGLEKKTRKYSAIAVGRLNEQKNFSKLIDIFSEFIIKDNNNWILRIVGEGEQYKLLEEKIKEKKLQGKVILAGKIKDMESEYQKSDICLMTSKYEGLPLALLEAKSYSIPCIAFDCKTGPKEIISNNKDGFVIEEGDDADFIKKMAMLSEDDALFYQMSRNTETVSKKFSTDRIKNKWLEVIKD